MVKVSIIIAVYNVERYLEKCLDSLLAQTLEDIEIIAVNDGSTDGSQAILDHYAKRSNKLKCFGTENGGAAAARNYGLSHASGEYIGYVDADDFVDPEMYEVLYEKAAECGSDIVECNLRHTSASGKDVDIEVMPRYYDHGELICFGRYVVWNKIYRRDWLLATGVRFPEGLIYEDVAFVAKLVPFIHKYDYVDIAPVHYVQRLSSVNNSTSEKAMHIFPVMEDIVAFYRENGLYETWESELEYLHMRIHLCSFFFRMCRIPDRAFRKKALRANWDFLNRSFPNWRKNAILKRSTFHQARYMKTVGAGTYPLYSVLASLGCRIADRVSRKWK